MKTRSKLTLTLIILITVSSLVVSFPTSAATEGEEQDVVCLGKIYSFDFYDDDVNYTFTINAFTTESDKKVKFYIQSFGRYIVSVKIKLKYKYHPEEEISGGPGDNVTTLLPIKASLVSDFFSANTTMPELPDIGDFIAGEFKVIDDESESTTTNFCICRGPDCPCPVPFIGFYGLIGIISLCSIYVFKKK